MSKSAMVRIADAQAVFRLVGECREYGHNPILWLTRLVEGVSRLLDAKCVQAGEFRFDGKRAWPVIAAETGGPTGRLRQQYIEWLSNPDLPDNPVWESVFARTDPHFTCAAEELMPISELEGTAHYNEVMVPSDLGGNALLSRRFVPADRSPHGIVINRGVRATPFNGREKAILSLLHTALADQFGAGLATAADPVATLSPRLRELLDCLLEGDSEKQVAARLGLSTSTIHDHVKRLYRHFGVGSRAELLAYFLRRYRGMPRN